MTIGCNFHGKLKIYNMEINATYIKIWVIMRSCELKMIPCPNFGFELHEQFFVYLCD